MVAMRWPVESQVYQTVETDTAGSAQDAPDDTVTLIMMPFLGGSWREWTEVMEVLSPPMRCVGVDLPGFGEAAETKGYSVAEMAEYVTERVKSLKLKRFLLVGHSMAGKVAMVVACNANREPELSGLCGLVLVASSPPSPEPMSDDKRAEMRTSLGMPSANYRKHAERYIRENASGELSPQVFERAVSDVLRMNLAAWTAWLDSGSKEDWSEHVGNLDIKALVVAGGEDKALGLEAQSKFVMPHLPNAHLEDEA